MSTWGQAAYRHTERLFEQVASLRRAHVVHLRVEHGLSIRRIAKRLGMRENEVKIILEDHND